MSEELFGKDYPDFNEHGAPPCAESFPDAFFSEDPFDLGHNYSRGRYVYELEVKKICFECPYQRRCLEYALKNPELIGIWGGTTEYQRRRIRRGEKVNIGLPPSRNR